MILKLLFNVLGSFLLVFNLSLLAQGKSFAKGSKVDVLHREEYWKAEVLETTTCYEVTYDSDGSTDVQGKPNMAPAGKRDSKGKGVAGKPGEVVDVLWFDGEWYPGKIRKSLNCYKVAFTAMNPPPEVFAPIANVFPNGSKIADTSPSSMFKGDTGQKRNWIVGYSADGSYTDESGNKIPADKVRQCLNTTDEWKCRGTSQCRYDFSKKACGPGGP